MANAAIYLNPEAYDTTAHQLMGRHSAGESFLRGYLRHSSAEHFQFWNVANNSRQKLDSFLNGFDLGGKPFTLIGVGDRAGLGNAGGVHLPSPQIAREAWLRKTAGQANRYAITAVAHTTATHTIMDAIGNLLIAPVEPWDALICTSRAQRLSVETQLEAVADHLRERIGATKLVMPHVATIPLGLDTEAFASTPEQRAAWRERLDIPADAIVALYVGRFSLTSKMNTAPMALALQAAAERTKREIYWVLSGWSPTEKHDQRFHEVNQAFCPSVKYRVVDGRKPDVRFSIWSVGDFFLSLSDNVQETFGLTPVEAMAAGLPSVISDWNGYKDLLRPQVDGFRIATYSPRAGLGRDLAYRYASAWDEYEAYVAGTSQFTAVDVEDAAYAITQLVNNADLRARMGAAAQARARSAFDWKSIIPQYEALWGELEARRLAAPPPAPQVRNLADNPYRMDPYRLFSSYPTEWFTPSSMVALARGMTPKKAEEILAKPNVRFARYAEPTAEEVELMIKMLVARRQAMVHELLAAVPPHRRTFVERGLIWLAKYGIVQILPRTASID